MRSFLSILLIMAALSACESDFDPTAPAGSTPYIMCVINAKDSAQYVRVQRSFIAHENAYNFSQNADSLYYRPEDIRVLLTRFDTLDGSIMGDPIVFYKTTEIPKDSGAFSQNGHYLFKTTEPIYAEFDYELSVEFLKENRKVTSRIQPLGSWNLPHAFNGEQRKAKYSWYRPERMHYFMDLTPSKHQQLTRFLYIEMSETDTLQKYIEYYHLSALLDDLDESIEDMDFLGDDFLLRVISREIPYKEKVKRKAVGVDYMLQLADSNMILYETVEDPNSNYLYTPEFSNIKNGGVGLFASRYKLTIFGKLLKPEELDSISRGQFTRHLNFADSKGNFPDGE